MLCLHVGNWMVSHLGRSISQAVVNNRLHSHANWAPAKVRVHDAAWLQPACLPGNMQVTNHVAIIPIKHAVECTAFDAAVSAELEFSMAQARAPFSPVQFIQITQMLCSTVSGNVMQCSTGTPVRNVSIPGGIDETSAPLSDMLLLRLCSQKHLDFSRMGMSIEPMLPQALPMSWVCL